jgi:hypothetical protein
MGSNSDVASHQIDGLFFRWIDVEDLQEVYRPNDCDARTPSLNFFSADYSQ